MDRRERPEGFPGQRVVVLPRKVVARALQRALLRDLLPTDVGYFPKAVGHYMERSAGVNQAIFIYCNCTHAHRIPADAQGLASNP